MSAPATPPDTVLTLPDLARTSWRVAPIYYLQYGDVVVAEARRDGELARPRTVEAVVRDATTGHYAIQWQPVGPWNHSSWMPADVLYVFGREDVG